MSECTLPHKFNYHGYITSVADFEHSVAVPAQDPDDTNRVILYLAKVGGGSVGKSYDGNWYVMLSVNGKPLYHGDRLTTRHAATHDQAARQFAAFLADAVSINDETLWTRLTAFSEGNAGTVTIAPGLVVRSQDEVIARRAYLAGRESCQQGH